MPSSVKVIPPQTNPDLEKERRAVSFNVEEFQSWWHGGVDKLREKREIENELFKDLVRGHVHHYLSYEDVYNASVQYMTEAATKLRRLQQRKNPGGTEIWPNLMYGLVSQGLMPANNPTAAHTTMFLDIVRSQGTPEQVAEYAKRAADFKILGAYVQTELGHGTYLRGLETRADYDPKTQEFVMNTPTLTSYKWWPGGLGHTANYAMVVAQLYIEGDHKGIQMFLVPIRDAEMHMPLPGVDVGDIGKKLGMQGTNHGFLGLKNVRIPRTNMLMRYSKVLPDGTFEKGAASKVAYITMVYTRCLIVSQNTIFLAEAATIATRYAAVRRQSPIRPDEPEPQIIDHVTQQLKLFPEIATVIAFRLGGERMWEIYEQTQQEIAKGVFNRLPDLHVLSCIMKVLCTADSTLGIERLRLSCGGHGYLAAANFGSIYGDAVAAVTYEGENTVLLLQVGRFLVKSWAALVNGESLPPSVAYFEQFQTDFPKYSSSWEWICKALQFAAANKTRIAFEQLSRRVAEGQTQQEAANNTGIELTKAAELHGRQFLVAAFTEAVTGAKAAQRSDALNNVLRNLLELFLVHTILNNMSDVLHFVPLTAADLSALQQRLEAALKAIRPDAVGICDGFDFNDHILNSVLGSFDGNVYERIFKSAKESPLNQKPVPKSFEMHLKPFLKGNL